MGTNQRDTSCLRRAVRLSSYIESVGSRGCGRRCPMQVAVELFGIPRARAGLAQTFAVGSNLGDVLADLARKFPPLAETCIDGRSLRPGFLVNLCAERFVTSP